MTLTRRVGWMDGQTNQDILNYYINHNSLDFQPGSDSEYSNSGYHLLAKIITRASGIRYEEFVQENILSPLKMSNSYVTDESTTPRANDALNYANQTTFSGQDNFTNGANGVVSSVNDMQLFMRGLLAGEIVMAENLETMLEHHTLNLFAGADYGYGFLLDPTGKDAFQHTGGHDGFITIMSINRENNRLVVLLGNGGEATGNHGYLLSLISQSLDSAGI